MIVIGTDTHKDTHTCAIVRAETGELLATTTRPARRDGFQQLLRWTRQHTPTDEPRVWAIEDCRQVSSSLERFLIERGERAVRLAAYLTANRRKSSRDRGKSDTIDAIAVARAALAEGLDTLPVAFLDDHAREIRLLVDHRQSLVEQRTRAQNKLRWLLHDRWPELQIPVGGLDRQKWLDTLTHKLAHTDPSADIRVCRDLLGQIRAQTRRVAELEREINALVTDYAPTLLQLPGVGPIIAAKLIGETANIHRFKNDAAYARLAGVAPIPASSGRTDRHRLDRGGNRQLNCAIHRIAITQGISHPPAREYLARRQAGGNSRRDAIRALKRHLARTIYTTLKSTTPIPHLT